MTVRTAVAPILSRYEDIPPLGSINRNGMKKIKTQITQLIKKVTKNGRSVFIIIFISRDKIRQYPRRGCE